MNDVATLFVCLCVAVWVAATVHLLILGHDRRTAPKFDTHMGIYTLNLNTKIDPPHQGVGLGGYILLTIFRDRPRPNLARMCGYILSP